MARIAEIALADRAAYRRLAELTDRIGHRLSGSPELDRAIAWAVKSLQNDGQENVHTERVMVPRWVRGRESAQLIAPIQRPLEMLGLGGSIGTPKGGLTAEVLSVSTYEGLEKLGPEAKGKIILFDNPMEDGTKYGQAVIFRASGAAHAAKQGAVGVLVRSVTPRSLRTPHTGSTHYEPNVKPIPAAAVSVEDATLITRLLTAGEKVRVRLEMGARALPDVPSANVIAELRGRERPEEIVVLGAHIDSWDVGQGAHDDGAGCVIVMDALRVLRALGTPPRRTVRVVLFTNEENGLRGAKAYAKEHAAELPHHVAGLEADLGGFRPKGFWIDGAPEAVRRMKGMAKLLGGLGADGIEVSEYTGADVGVLQDAGIATLGLWMDVSTYFDYHHSEADTLDKVDPADLQQAVAATAAMAHLLADDPEPLPQRPPAKASEP